MSITKEAYEFTKEYLGLTEVLGPQDNRMIEVAHRLCKVESPKGGANTDEIPWCSSWVVLAIVCANIRRNPKKAFEMLERKDFEESLIKECFAYAKVPWESRDKDTLKVVVPPTWSASSRSWDMWGVGRSVREASRGDIVRLTRDGGGHVAFLDEDSVGAPFMRLLGGNQANKVSSSQSYARARLVTVRGDFAASDLSIQPILADKPTSSIKKVASSPKWLVGFKNKLKQLFKA